MTEHCTHGPLIIQSDRTIMLEVVHPQYADCRDFLAMFAELVKSPEFIHTYRVTPLSLWNAAALGIPFSEIIAGIQQFSRYDPPANVLTDIRKWFAQYGLLILEKTSDNTLRLIVKDKIVLNRLGQLKDLAIFWQKSTEDGWLIDRRERGNLKQALIKTGYPVKDLCGYIEGDKISVALRAKDIYGHSFALRNYQQEAVNAFYQNGKASGGSGIIVLPCGSGKTIIGIGVMQKISEHTLIIAANNVSVHQWRDEIQSKTSLEPDLIGEFTGLEKNVKPITITTYQMLTWRASKSEPMKNLEIFNCSLGQRNWGLIIYDEVHILPAPVLRAAAEIQARRRLGLTATLVREDGKEDEVFALIGPKRYDVPWKTLEHQGFIAEAICTEYRIPLPPNEEIRYALADKRNRFRIASENPQKIEVTQELIANHPNDQILIIGQYISQLETIARTLNYPLITGKTNNTEREALFADFKTGKLPVLIVSKIANFSIDLPDANVMIQISGSFGSRQEEAQRLGRILRPKERLSRFYTLVSKSTDEQDFALNRQLFLVEQGYKYQIRYA